MSGMLSVLETLKKSFDGEFVITPQVRREIIDQPKKIKKFKLEAIQVENLFEKGVLKLSSEFVSNNKVEKETQRLLKLTNSFLRSADSGEKISIIHEGEASCIAFSNLCKEENVIVIDERSTRWISEAPKDLETLMEKKLHTPLNADFSMVKEFSKIKYIRSAELIFVAFKKGLIPLKKNRDLLDAMLYGLKFNGTAISSSEIEEMKTLA